MDCESCTCVAPDSSNISDGWKKDWNKQNTERSIGHFALMGFISNGGLARRHVVALKIEKPGAKGCLGGITSAGWLEDHNLQSFSREMLFELCKKTLLFLKF